MITQIREQEDILIKFAEKIIRQRYRLGIACGNIASRKTEIAQLVGKRLQGGYINLASELLPKTVQDGFSPILGAYGPDDLIEFVLRAANKTEVKLIIIDQIEPLLSTFGRTKTVLFFRMLSQVEPLKPVIFITYLKKQITEAHFPNERVLYL